MRTCIASCCCFYGWVEWIVLAVGQITVFLGASSGVTFIIQPVRDELNLTQTSVAFAYTIGTAFSALVQLPIGRSVDRWGGRMGVVVYSAAFYASVTCLSLPTNWTNLAVAFGLLRAFGVGGLELAANTCLQQWFERRRGLATGLLQSLNAILSYAGISNVVAALVHAFGWRMTYWYLGLLLVCTYTPLAALLLRSRPEDVGMLPDGVPSEPAVPPWAPAQPLACARESASEEAESDTMEATATRLASGRAAKGNGSSSMAPEEPWTLSEAIRTRTFVILALGNAFAWGIGSG